MDYPKISIDKVDQEIHRFEQTPMAQPVVQQQQQATVTGTTSPVVPPQRQVTPPAQTASLPQAPPPDLSGMVSNVTSNFAGMQKQMPEPQLPVNDGLKILGGLGLLAAGGLGLNKLLSEKEPTSVKPGSIESRKIGAGPQMNVNTGEPRMVGDLFPADVSTKPIAEPTVTTGKTFEQLDAEYEVLKKEHAANMLEYEANKKAFNEKYPLATPSLQPLPAPETSTVPLTTEVGKAPKEMPMIEKATGTPEKKAVAEGRKQATDTTVKSFERDAKGNIKYPEGMTPAAKAGAEAFAAQYPDQAKAFAAKGQFGILGAGSSMNSLYNTYGENVAKQLRNELVSGNLLGGAQEYPEIRSKIAAIPPESATGKQLADIIEKNPKGGIYGSLGKSVTMKEGKLIEGKNYVPDIVKKGIGPAVLLMSIADAAKAKSAREGAGVLAEGVFNALTPMGISPSELASATLTEKQLKAFREAQKLGSPYRSVPPPR